MKATTLTLCIALAGCTSSCGGTTPHVSWPSVVACADVVRDDLIGTVQAALVDHTPDDAVTTRITDRAVSELERLAAEHGAQVVACLVDQAVHSFDRAAVLAQAQAQAPVPAEPPARARGLFSQPPPDAGVVAAEPVRTLPDEQTAEQLAAARGRDFLQRVAKTRVEGE